MTLEQLKKLVNNKANIINFDLEIDKDELNLLKDRPNTIRYGEDMDLSTLDPSFLKIAKKEGIYFFMVSNLDKAMGIFGVKRSKNTALDGALDLVVFKNEYEIDTIHNSFAFNFLLHSWHNDPILFKKNTKEGFAKIPKDILEHSIIKNFLDNGYEIFDWIKRNNSITTVKQAISIHLARKEQNGNKKNVGLVKYIHLAFFDGKIDWNSFKQFDIYSTIIKNMLNITNQFNLIDYVKSYEKSLVSINKLKDKYQVKEKAELDKALNAMLKEHKQKEQGEKNV